LLGLFSIGASSASAQTESKQDKSKDPQDEPLARIETIEVKIPLRAFDPLGKRVLDLTPKDVIVIENGAGRQVTSLKMEPANILLVLDQSLEMSTVKNDRSSASRSIETKGGPNRWLNAPEEFAGRLISQLGETDHIAVIQYSDKVELIQNWTADRKEVARTLRTSLRQGRKTRYYDALMLAAKTLRNSPTGRPILVLLTDGVDTASEAQKGEALAAIAHVGATIYVVNWAEVLKNDIEKTSPKIYSGHGGTPKDTVSAGMSIDISPWVFKRRKERKEYLQKIASQAQELNQIAENTGGENYLPKSLDELVGKSNEIMSEIGAQYTLRFLTERKSGEETMREVQVLGARMGLSVYARKKYYIAKELAETKKGTD
jgi:VWFA-related protein